MSDFVKIAARYRCAAFHKWRAGATEHVILCTIGHGRCAIVPLPSQELFVMTERYLGIDVGFSTRRASTGLCLLTVTDDRLHWRCLRTGSQRIQRLRSLKDLVPGGADIDSVGIDGPLTHGFRLVNRHRSTDSLLMRDVFQRRCKPGSTKGTTGQGLHRHATELVTLIMGLEHGEHFRILQATHPERIHTSRIIETFPDAFLGVLFPDGDFANIQLGRGKSDRFWEKAVRDGLLIGLIKAMVGDVQMDEELDHIVNHDHRAAFVCALAALCVAKNRYVSGGDPTDGYICLPPLDLWGGQAGSPNSWAENALRRSVVLVQRGARRQINHSQVGVFRNGEEWM